MFEKYVYIEIHSSIWPVSGPHGQDLLHPRTHAHVPETIPEGNGAAGSRLHRHCPAHQFLHRSCHLHPNQAEHPEPLDAQLHHGLHHTRNHGAGVLLLHHVSYPGRQGGFEHRLRDWHHACDPAD